MQAVVSQRTVKRIR